MIAIGAKTNEALYIKPVTMKIFIDTILHTIYEWEGGEMGNELLSLDFRDNSGFTRIMDKILTPSQMYNYAGGNDIVYTLSKKKADILKHIITEHKKQTP